MTFVNDIRGYETNLVSRMVASARGLASAYEARRNYLKTLHELEALDTRALADLGINRGEIQAVAYEAVYGK